MQVTEACTYEQLGMTRMKDALAEEPPPDALSEPGKRVPAFGGLANQLQISDADGIEVE